VGGGGGGGGVRPSTKHYTLQTNGDTTKEYPLLRTMKGIVGVSGSSGNIERSTGHQLEGQLPSSRAPPVYEGAARKERGKARAFFESRRGLKNEKEKTYRPASLSLG